MLDRIRFSNLTPDGTTFCQITNSYVVRTIYICFFSQKVEVTTSRIAVAIFIFYCSVLCKVKYVFDLKGKASKPILGRFRVNVG